MYCAFQKYLLKTLPLVVALTAGSGCTLKTAGSANPQNATANTVQSSASPTISNQTTTPQPQSVQPKDSTNTARESGKWLVTDPVEPERPQAQVILETAQQALQNGQYAEALKYAAQSYHEAPRDETRSLAAYAASHLSPIELANLEATITMPLEAAIIGQLRLNTCASQHDNACVAAILPQTADALDAIGDHQTAENMRTWLASASNDNHPVVAVLLPLSGTDRRIGRAMLGAILQASGIYHHAPLPFALRFFDTQSNAQNIPGILQNVQNLGAKLILGPLDIQESMAVAPKLTEMQAVMVGFSPNHEFTKQNSAAFQFSYAMPQEAEHLAQTLVALNARTIIAVSPEDAYATASVQQLQASLPLGMTVSTLTYPPTQTDLRTIAQKVASQSPDVVYLPSTIDTAERIASFLAQENIWCKTPGTPAPKSKIDTRKFITCLGTSAWAPVADNHRYKSLTEALYLDYTSAATTHDSHFATQFNALYHRLPAVHEILPFVAISMLKTLPDAAWQNSATLQSALQTLFRGQQYLMLPSLRQITATGSQNFDMISTTTPTLERTLSTAPPSP